MKTNFEKLGFIAASLCGLAVFLMAGAAEAQSDPAFECEPLCIPALPTRGHWICWDSDPAAMFGEERPNVGFERIQHRPMREQPVSFQVSLRERRMVDEKCLRYAL